MDANEPADYHEGLAQAEEAAINPDRGRAKPPEVRDDGFGGRILNLYRRDHAEAVLRNSTVFSTRVVAESMTPFMGPLMLGMDGDEHTAYRGLVSQAFRSSALARSEMELVAPIINERLDGLRLDSDADPPLVRGVAFRGPEELHAVWDA